MTIPSDFDLFSWDIYIHIYIYIYVYIYIYISMALSIYTHWFASHAKELRSLLLKALQEVNLKDVKLKPVLSSLAFDEGDP